MKTQIQVPRAKQHCTIKNIAVFGSADVDELHPVYQEAFKVARYLAYHGKVIVNGGGPGVMAAATLGAQAAGGETMAVTFYPADMPFFEGRYAGNHVDKEIKTANYIERMFGLMDNADAFICFQGGTGTLSEWTTAWLLGHLYFGNHKPVILYGHFWHEVMRVISDNFFIGETESRVYRIADDEKQLIQVLEEFELELQQSCQLHSHESEAVQSGPGTLASANIQMTSSSPTAPIADQGVQMLPVQPMPPFHFEPSDRYANLRPTQPQALPKDATTEVKLEPPHSVASLLSTVRSRYHRHGRLELGVPGHA